MKVLGVDPGYDRLGVAVMEKQHGQEKLLYSDCIETDKSSALSERLADLGGRFEEVLLRNKPDIVAIETLFFSKNQKTALFVAEARGVIVYLAAKHGCVIKEYGPGEVKVAVTGWGNSDKRSIMTMLKRLVTNLPERALDDEYDAIAVAVTAIAHQAR